MVNYSLIAGHLQRAQILSINPPAFYLYDLSQAEKYEFQGMFPKWVRLPDTEARTTLKL